jgi:asparagine synthase (glutamine-hydrolysing)
VSDVPVGAFLSGGIDSSLVAAIAQKHYPEPLETFTIGFGGGHDERAYARMVAAHIGSHHHEKLAEPDLTGLLPLFIWHLEQPLFDNSVLPTFLVSELASKQGKVVLSGDGGDETFAGYDWTRFALVLPHLPLPWEPTGWKWLYQNGLSGFLKRLLFDLGNDARSRYLRRMTSPIDFRQWLYTEDFLATTKGDPVSKLAAFLSQAPIREDPERFLYCDLQAYLPEDVLFKVDRMSMAHGLEVRVPLLDHKLMEWLFRLPFHMRFRRGHGKYLLRKVAERYLPSFILKPRKQGFTIPISVWLRGSLGDTAEALFSSRVFAARDMIQPGRALTLLEMHRRGDYDLGHRIWSLIVLEVWARIWLDGRACTNSLDQIVHEDEG